MWRVLKMLGASPAPLRDKVVLHAVDDGVVLGGSPMPEPVRSSLQGPWCFTGYLCWASRSLDLVRKVHCVPSMLCYVGVVCNRGALSEDLHVVPCDALSVKGLEGLKEGSLKGCPGGWWASRSFLGTPPGSGSSHEEGDGMRGVQESQDGEVECYLVQPVGCCTTAAVSLELLWRGWLGWLGC